MRNPSALALQSSPELYVRQRHELGELLGFETRNKYAITTPDRSEVAFAAEQQKGVLGFLLRQFMGHWRTFEIHFFGPDRGVLFRAVHPFRFLFQRLEVVDAAGRLVGAIQQRFAVLERRFDVLAPNGQVLLEMRSGLFKLWTFPFFKQDQQAAVIEKKWSGAISELFTDKDNFRIRFAAPLSPDERTLIVAAAIFVDLQYFERKAS